MIKNNILEVRKRITEACVRVHTDAHGIVLVVVSKGRSLDDRCQAIAGGITDIGENKVQEAKDKYVALQATGCRLQDLKWHMVGHLQTNKVKEAVKIFDLIHSVDSVRLTKEIDKEAAKINKIQDILIQVNTSGEVSKFGLKPQEAIEALCEVTQLKNVQVEGLMTIAPLVDNQEKARFCFRVLRELRDKANSILSTQYVLQTLSMGMTDDFEVAIEEGSTMIRIGRAIFQ